MNLITPENDTLGIGFSTIKAKYPLPSFVKESSYREVQEEGLTNLPSSIFGDPIHRQYPCHTKAATWLSCAYFTDNFDSIDPDRRTQVQRRLEKRAEFFNILPEIRQLIRRKSEALVKSATPVEYPSSYYLFIRNDSGKPVRQGLMNTEEAVIKAASWVIDNRDDLTLSKCADCAQRILSRADDLGVNLANRDRLERMSGVGVSDPKSLLTAIGVRTSLCKNAELNAQLRKLAETVKNSGLTSMDSDMMKVAVALDDFDKAADLLSLRRKGEIQLPEESCFRHSLTELTKLASDTVHLQTGEVYSLSKLATLSRIKFESVLGSDLADECFEDLNFRAKNASAVLATLPRPDAERIGAFFKDNGIEPETTTKAASAITIPQELLDQFA